MGRYVLSESIAVQTLLSILPDGSEEIYVYDFTNEYTRNYSGYYSAH